MKVKIVKMDDKAVMPSRAHPTDIGWDLTAIYVKKIFPNGVVLYGTGIAVQPPSGYYTEILPRSSASKTDMILANGVGIIDPDYSGELFIAVRHMDCVNFEDFYPNKKFYLEKPFCKFQLIMRKAYQFDFEEVKNLDETDRGAGGFGSSDKKE